VEEGWRRLKCFEKSFEKKRVEAERAGGRKKGESESYNDNG